ncbi:glycosyltransferase, partial [uncultured Eudoraea sp.]|uniref:glycosyltransferase family 4 protein n=1 Tax=uncultured Eudoraea sp. TaxID=1035614 RepID=UPI00262EB4CF
MKILFIHNNYASNTSGEEIAAEALERLLTNNGHEVVWYRRFSDIINNSFSKKVSAFFLGIYNPKAVKEIRALLASFEPDVVQIQNLYPFISPAIIKTIKRKGIPIVMRCPNYRLFCPTGLHMDGKGKICEKCLSVGRELNCITKNCEKDYAKSIGYALRNFLARTLWGLNRNMDAYIVQTAFQREKFIKNGIEPKKLYIVPGITPSIPASSESFESEYVSFVGRVSEEKGIMEFLEAARLLPMIPFMVAGSVRKPQASLKANAPDNVLWKGFLSGKDLDLFYKQSRIVVVPSKWYEGFPNVITQAMKHGKPLITSNLGAMSDIIDHEENGLLVEPGDTIGLAKAIQELYKDTIICNLYGANAKKKAATLYSSNKVYDYLMDLYSGLLKEKEKNAKKILFILHYPPPVHGAAMVGQYIMESNSLNDNFDCQYINLGTSIRVDEIGIGGWQKFKRYLKIIKQTSKSLYNNKPNLVYITLTASGAGFYKDTLIIMLAKAFGKKVVFHFHNKGISKRQDNFVDNLLYKKVFKKSEVILLSKHLYYDIEKYVPIERVHYCANGIPENRITKPIPNVVNDEVQILFLSNLIESKGVFVL